VSALISGAVVKLDGWTNQLKPTGSSEDAERGK